MFLALESGAKKRLKCEGTAEKTYETFKHICRVADSGNCDGCGQRNGLAASADQCAGYCEHFDVARRLVDGFGSGEVLDLALRDHSTCGFEHGKCPKPKWSLCGPVIVPSTRTGIGSSLYTNSAA